MALAEGWPVLGTTIVVGTHTSAATAELTRIPHYADITISTESGRFVMHP